MLLGFKSWQKKQEKELKASILWNMISIYSINMAVLQEHGWDTPPTLTAQPHIKQMSTALTEFTISFQYF